jgi:hypothetical protein
MLGAACLSIVVLAHVAEAIHFLPAMRWGQQASAGHHLDLAAAVLGVTLFPLGFFLDALTDRRST